MPGLDLRLRVSSLAGTRSVARDIARCLAQGDVVLLEGELGAGKSELARGIIQEWLGAPVDVPSPTFTLVQRYDRGDCPITHADLYRINDLEELVELGLDEAGDLGVLIVEWPSRAGANAFPASALTVEIGDAGGDKRTLHFRSSDEGWRHRLAHLVGSR